MIVVFIHGPAASGKYTIGKALSASMGWPLFHNHLAVDAALSLFEFGTEGFCDLRAEIWRAGFAEAARRQASFVFTFHPEATVDPALIDELVSIIEAVNGTVVFIELKCTDAVIRERLGNEGRARFGKLTDRALYEQIEQEGGFVFPSLPAPLLSIDTERIDAQNAASQIQRALEAVGASVK